MIAGFLSGRENELVGDSAAIAISGQETETLEKFLRFLDLLRSTREALSIDDTIQGWRAKLTRLVGDWFDLSVEDTAEAQTITHAIDRWSSLLIEADFQESLTSDWVCAWFKEKLGEPRSLMRCLLYTSPSPRDRTRSRMSSSA